MTWLSGAGESFSGGVTTVVAAVSSIRGKLRGNQVSVLWQTSYSLAACSSENLKPIW